MTMLGLLDSWQFLSSSKSWRLANVLFFNWWKDLPSVYGLPAKPLLETHDAV